MIFAIPPFLQERLGIPKDQPMGMPMAMPMMAAPAAAAPPPEAAEAPKEAAPKACLCPLSTPKDMSQHHAAYDADCLTVHTSFIERSLVRNEKSICRKHMRENISEKNEHPTWAPAFLAFAKRPDCCSKSVCILFSDPSNENISFAFCQCIFQIFHLHTFYSCRHLSLEQIDVKRCDTFENVFDRFSRTFNKVIWTFWQCFWNEMPVYLKNLTHFIKHSYFCDFFCFFLQQWR